MVNHHPTPYPDVNDILAHLQTKINEVLDDQIVGMYLFGSLANGGFDQDSDIDVLVVTDGEISADTFMALSEMHTKIRELDSPWAIQLEVSYIPQAAIRRFDPADIRHPHIDRGSAEKLYMLDHANDWIIQRYIVREHGIVLAGPDPKTLIDPVSPDDLRQAVVNVWPIWITPILEDPSIISKWGYQSFFVLSICRVIYTFKYGEIISKKAASEWAKENLDKRWLPLIERAWEGRQKPGLDATQEDINGTLDMMRYAQNRIQPTSYPDVNEVLNLLLAEAQGVLGEQFIGMYLYGSLSSGDFDLDSSDIDFLIVTADILDKKTINALDVMHQRIWDSGPKWAAKLEGSYLPHGHLPRYEKTDTAYPTINEGKFYLAPHGSDWIIQRHIIREQGVTLWGANPKPIIEAVSPDDIRRAVTGILEEWWFPLLDDPSWLRNHGVEYHAFTILTMCRSLYALEFGEVVSKPIAARWAQEALGGKWPEVIEQSLVARTGASDFELYDDAIEAIRYTMKKLNRNKRTA